MIRERRPGVWEVVVYAGVDPITQKKKRVSRTVRGTKSAAVRRHAQLLLEVHDDGHRPAAETTVGAVVDTWLEHAAPDLSPTTVRGYRRCLEHQIRPALGDLPLARLTTRRLDTFYADLRKTGLAPATIRQSHAILRRALGQARKWGWLAVNPAEDATPPTVRREEISPPSADTVAKLVEKASTGADADTELALAVWLAAVTGARRGELCGLQWADVDLQANMLAINRAVIEDDHQVLIKDTKTHAARRIAIDAPTVELLEAQRRLARERALTAGAKLGDRSFVFSDDVDYRTPLAPGRLSERFRQLCRRCDAEVRFHDLRHFAATQALAAGVPVRTVSGRLGHANASTTLSVYGHFIEASDRDAAEKLGGLLDRARTARAR